MELEDSFSKGAVHAPRPLGREPAAPLFTEQLGWAWVGVCGSGKINLPEGLPTEEERIYLGEKKSSLK